MSTWLKKNILYPFKYASCCLRYISKFPHLLPFVLFVFISHQQVILLRAVTIATISGVPSNKPGVQQDWKEQRQNDHNTVCVCMWWRPRHQPRGKLQTGQNTRNDIRPQNFHKQARNMPLCGCGIMTTPHMSPSLYVSHFLFAIYACLTFLIF